MNNPSVVHSDPDSIPYSPAIADFTAEERGIQAITADILTSVNHTVLFAHGLSSSVVFLEDMEPHVATTGERIAHVYREAAYCRETKPLFLRRSQGCSTFYT